ncbi:hypothetical protein AVBRAN12642_02670 [Campylobacter sp. RM12642]|uniref:hypothetical protein n=1 Tax=unclassified Campylobacter TaxID=2593542 RepID=UPI001DD211ED|nr:hypothetical protein [Campylobacter sp. RM12642]MBZ8006937.1 hypothetical protein [Campylobacter sp. RM9334]
MKNFLKGFSLCFSLFIFFILGLISTKIYEYLINKDEIVIEQTIEVEKRLNYDSYISNPKFTMTKQLSIKENLNENEKNEIEELFSKVLERVKESNLCEGGSYILQPNIAYQDGMNIPNGYKFDSALRCEFKKEEYQNYKNLLKDIDNILANNEYITINSPALNLSVSKEEISIIKQELYDEIFKKAIGIKDKYSNLTNKICEIKSIKHYEIAQNQILGADYKYDDTPIEKDSNFKLNATLELTCK